MKSLRITPVDDDAVENGAWANYRGVRLKIARANNSKFRSLFMRLTKPYQKDLSAQNASSLDENVMRDIMAKALSEAILMDWDNFIIDGEAIPFSKENAYSLLYNDEDCREFVTEFSRDLDNYIRDEENSLSGKS